MHGEILIIEDSPTQAAHLRYILEKQGYRVMAATNGREALGMLTVKIPELIITDVIMPEMDGYELCRHIKTDERFRSIPVILLTSLSDPLDVIRGLECGADSFITKPYEETTLLSRIVTMQMGRQKQPAAEETDALEIVFDRKKFTITADRRQALNLLLSTYEAAIQKNRELTSARDELNDLNERMAAANRDLEAFNYTVSHDLRTPLTGICGASELLLEVYGDRLDPECTEWVRTIRQSARQMNRLIDTLLNFSRLTRTELVRQWVDLSMTARSIMAELAAKDPHRRVQTNIANGITVKGDAKLLEVVLQNLMGNAWKYSGKREGAVIEFGVKEIDGAPAFFVRDNGAGFDADQKEKLFSPFQRLHEPEEFEGCGIGLATVQRIIERHGGSIWAEGEVDKGATFYFTLPS